MLTAERFALTGSSYWTTALPRLEHFVRISNVGSRKFTAPMQSTDHPRRHALVSETAFYLWAQHIAGTKPNLVTATTLAKQRLSRVSGQVDLGGSLDEHEIPVVLDIAKRINYYCSAVRPLYSIEVEPTLPGCGWLSGGLPDLIGDTYNESGKLTAILEFKCVDRPFRSVDFRQMVAYVVLYFASYMRLPDVLLVVNPLRGTAIEVGVDEFFEDVVGAPAPEVVNHLLVDWSTAGVSP